MLIYPYSGIPTGFTLNSFVNQMVISFGWVICVSQLS